MINISYSRRVRDRLVCLPYTNLVHLACLFLANPREEFTIHVDAPVEPMSSGENDLNVAEKIAN